MSNFLFFPYVLRRILSKFKVPSNVGWKPLEKTDQFLVKPLQKLNINTYKKYLLSYHFRKFTLTFTKFLYFFSKLIKVTNFEQKKRPF